MKCALHILIGDWYDNMGQDNVKQIVEGIRKKYSTDEFERIVQQYLLDYRGAYEGDDMEMIYEEVLADAYAGMNRFATVKSAVQYQDTVRSQTQRGTDENKRATRDTRGAPEQKFSFAGERSKTADMEALALAKEMQEQDVDRETILRETGWFVGADGKWRYEIDDSAMEFRKDGDARLMQEEGYRRLEELTQKWEDSFENGAALTNAEEQEMQELQEQYEEYVWREKYLLRDFLKHDELFDAYPYMNRISLVFDDLPMGENGYFSKRSNTIVLSDKLFGKEKETVLHEIQHIIQKVEDFARGASPEYWNRRMGKGFSKRWDNGFEMMPSELYRNTAGEIEARDAAARMDMTADERRNTFPNIGDENTVFAENSEEEFNIDNTRKMSWKDQVNGYFRGDNTIKRSDSLYIGESNVDGVQDSPLYIPTSVVTKAIRAEKGSRSAHNLVKNDILKLQDGIKNAPAIVHNPARNAIIYITGNRDSNGNYIIAAFDLNNNLRGENAHKATTIHGRENIATLLERLGEDATVFVKNENKLNQMLSGDQILKSLALLAKVEFVNQSITGDNEVVKQKFSFDDEDYLLAVRAGDMDAAQEMVDEAAQKTGYTVKAYHGTNENFNVFRSENGRYFFSKSEDYAEAMMEERSGQRIVEAYLKMENPYREKLDEGEFSDPSFEKPILDYAEQNGYDSAIIEVDTDNELVADTFYVVFSPEQIKSADPVTYDDDGNIIPISERFNTGKTDIRYSFEDDVAELDEAYRKEMDSEPMPHRTAESSLRARSGPYRDTTSTRGKSFTPVKETPMALHAASATPAVT